jgi:hypothetical protein
MSTPEKLLDLDDPDTWDALELSKCVEDFWMEVVVNLTSLLSRSKAVPHEKIAELFRERDSTTEPAKTREMEYTLPEEPEPDAHPSPA